jgi:hypothetical protein
MIAPPFREKDSPHRLMNPHQTTADIFSLNKNYARSSSEGSSSSETSSDSSSDESGMETEQSNLVSLPSTNPNSNLGSSYNAHATSADIDMAMLHSMGSNTVVNEDDTTIPPPAPRTNPPTTSQSSSTSSNQTDSFKRTLTEVCHQIVYNSVSTQTVTGRDKEVSEIGKCFQMIPNSQQKF